MSKTSFVLPKCYLMLVKYALKSYFSPSLSHTHTTCCQNHENILTQHFTLIAHPVFMGASVSRAV